MNITNNIKEKMIGIINTHVSTNKSTVIHDIETGFITGKYAHGEHYSIDEIGIIWDELNSPTIVEETPLEEEV